MSFYATCLKSKELFNNWVHTSIPSNSVIRFRTFFAAIWLSYDLLDFLLGGTRAVFWLDVDRTIPQRVTACQVGLIFCELGMVLGFRPRIALLLALLLRGVEAYYFPLNDFLYYFVTAFLLLHFNSTFLGKKGEGQRWVRDVLVGQTAWIYFCTALLKLNPLWLSGGDLYSRQMFEVMMRSWAYPTFYKNLVTQLQVNSALAWMAVLGEFTLAIVLAYWCWRGRQKKWVSLTAATLAVLIHGFAAIALNVWFFGASMIAQVVFLTFDKNQIVDSNASSPLATRG